MARALRITFPGAFYHVTSRGNERIDVFKSKHYPYTVQKLKSIGKYFGLSESAVFHDSKRAKIQVENDKKLKIVINATGESHTHDIFVFGQSR